MTRYCGRIVIGLAALFLLGLAIRVPAGDQVPVKGSLAGTFTYSPTSLAPGDYQIEINVRGEASHLGRATVVVKATVRLDENLKPIPVPPSNWTLTAANGDKLNGTMSWQGVQVGLFDFAISATLKVTGGTGRFKNASGGGSGTGTLNALTGEATFSVEGAISSPGANKK